MKKFDIPKEDEIPYLKILLYIASIDEILSEEELEFFTIEGTNAGLSEQEIDFAINWIKTKNVALAEICKDITNEKTKSILISRLLELCYADGDYSIVEKSGLIDVCMLLDFELKEFKKLENKAEFNFRIKKKSEKIKYAGKKGSNFVVSGIGAIGSKIALNFENAKKAKQENKELRERLRKDSITEAVKQKVILQLHSKIQSLAVQLKEERKRNEQNEKMIELLREQIADLESTIVVAENAKTA